jgi:hypothetical protein
MLTRNKIVEAIKNSTEKAQAGAREHLLFGRIYVYVNSPVMPEVDVHSIIEQIESIMPPHLMYEIDEIFIGMFDENEDRALEAHYEDGALFISNMLASETDYVENIVHETSHSLEEKYGLNIYGDRKIEEEFLGKRRRLFHILKQEGYDVEKVNFEEVEYSKEFDNFLYQEIGYDVLNSLVVGLFVSPYGSTSLREYFANGFEEYFLGDRAYLMNTSVQLYRKILEIIEDELL